MSTNTVVMIEDDPILRSAYRTILTRGGFKVLVARDGKEGLQLAQGEEPDLILLDMLMPNVGGLDFLRQYEVKTKHPQTKIIVFSNMADPKEEQEALDLGASLYLIKANFVASELMDVINKLLSQNKPNQ